MKILLNFSLSNCRMEVDYRRTFMSFKKKSVYEIENGKYFKKYYLDIKRRPFTFAVNLPSAKFANNEIELGKNALSLTFSTGDNLAGFVFFSAFIAQINKPFAMPLGNNMTLVKVTKLSEKTVDTNSALVKMHSPLCLRMHNASDNSDHYYSVESKDFSQKASEILCDQLIAEGFCENLARSIEIVPINSKKTVVKHYGCKLECSLGEFVINADKAVINYFLRYGIGSRKSSGFGFCELITQA